MSKQVKLKNKTGRMLVFNLEHASFVDRPGANGLGKPESLTFLARQELTVDEEVLSCVEVKSALSRKGNKAPSLQVVG